MRDRLEKIRRLMLLIASTKSEADDELITSVGSESLP